MEKLTDFEYYSTSFNGKLVPQETFEKYNIMATSKVNYFTSNRINVDNISNNIKNCTCEIIELLYFQNNNKELLNSEINGKQIQSETVGPHSVTYANNVSTLKKQIYNTDELDEEIYKICLSYLGHTGLMYRGA